jgi:hypothetical protein
MQIHHQMSLLIQPDLTLNINNIQIGNPITVNIGKLLTVMREQDNTIRILSKAIGQNYNKQ